MAIDESNFSITNVDRLIYLYSQAMEYFESEDKNKYKSFYDWLQKLLSWPEVFDAMKTKKPKKSKKKNKENKNEQPKHAMELEIDDDPKLYFTNQPQTSRYASWRK